MSIATKLTKLETDITNAYNVVVSKGGTLPTDKNTENLPDAINSIQTGGSFSGFQLVNSGTANNTNASTLTIDLGTEPGDMVIAQLDADSTLTSELGFYAVISYGTPTNANFPKWRENALHTFMVGWYVRTAGLTTTNNIGFANTSSGYNLDTSNNHYLLQFTRTAASYPIKTGNWKWYVYKYTDPNNNGI